MVVAVSSISRSLKYTGDVSAVASTPLSSKSHMSGVGGSS